MRSSHGHGGEIPPILHEVTGQRINTDNLADISGLASGPSSDEINDAQGRPREGQISPPPPRPHFARLNLNTDQRNPAVDREVVAWHGNSPNHPHYVPPAEFEPILTDLSTVVFGWLADSTGDEWFPVEDVRRLAAKAGRVVAKIDDENWITIADYSGCQDGAERARIERGRIAMYIGECKGYVFENENPTQE